MIMKMIRIYRTISVIIMLFVSIHANYSFGQYDSVFRFNQEFIVDVDTATYDPPEGTVVSNIDPEVYYWGENNEGLTPSDILYLEETGKLYVYGSRGVAVVDPVTLSTETFIPLSVRGQYNQASALVLYSGNRMAFDGDDRLYCFTDEYEIKVIDLETNTVIDSTNKLLNAGSTSSYSHAILRYDKKQDHILLVLDGLSCNNARCYRFNPANLQSYYNISLDISINDFVIHETENHLFVSYVNCFPDSVNLDTVLFYFHVFNNNFVPLSSVEPFEYPIEYKNIEYVYDTINGVHKAYCFPHQMHNNRPDVLVFSGDDYEKNTIRLDVHQRFVTSAQYVPDDQKLYFSYCFAEETYDGIGSINISNIVQDINTNAFPLEYTSDLLVTEDKFYLAKTNRLLAVDKTSPYDWSVLKDYSYDWILSLSEAADKVFAVNHANCAVEVFDSDGDFVNSRVLGGAALKGVFIETHEKVFMYKSESDIFQRVHIKNMLDNSVQNLDFTGFGYTYISGMVSDNENGLVYVSVATDPYMEGKVKIIDAATGSILPNDFALPANTTCRKLYLENSKLYCLLEYYETYNTVFSRIYIIELDNPGLTHLLTPNQPQLTGQLYGAFETKDNGDILLALNDRGSASHGRLITIDGANNTILPTLHGVLDPIRISYDPLNNKAYFTSYSFTPVLGIVDLNSNQVSHVSLDQYDFIYLIDAYYDIYRNEICVVGHRRIGGGLYAQTKTKIVYVNPIDFSVRETDMNILPLSISVAYNPVSGELYTFFPGPGNSVERIGILTRTGEYMQLIDLPNKQRSMGTTAYFGNEMFFDEGYTALFIPNNFHSNFYRVPLHPDQVELDKEGITWLSFPRLERDAVTGNMLAVDALTGRIEPAPGQLDEGNMAGRPFDEEENDYIDWIRDSTKWIPRPPDEVSLAEVNSKSGYILTFDYFNGTPNTLDLFGDLLDPDATIDHLYPIHDNWVGYWLTESQYPLDAFADVLDDLTYIKGQRWFCARQPNPNKMLKDSSIQYPNHQYHNWTCPYYARMEYGGMAKVLPNKMINNFQYNYSGNEPAIFDIPETEHYTFTEKEDYTAMVVELEEGDDPDEIGAFAGDSCIGAVVVETSDSVVHLQAYTEGHDGEEITFEKYYGTSKSTPRKVSEYMVLNAGTMVREKRTINTIENKPLYFISFKNAEDEQSIVDSPLWMHCRPNPFTGSCTIEYFIPETSHVMIEVLDIFGRPVAKIENSTKNPGTYAIQWKATVCTEGIYLIRFTTESGRITQKVVYVY